MQLHAELNPATKPSQNETLVLIHGLFGSLSNLGMLARALQQDHDVLQIDLRNHGKSAHTDSMTYEEMAQDVLDTLDALEIDQFSVIGHSMGGKVAMRLTQIAPERLQKLIVLDMAPFAYTENHHDLIFKALFAVDQAQVLTRQHATEIMKNDINENGVILFLLKSWSQGNWLFNLNGLHQAYPHIIAWNAISTWTKSTLFLRGENSDYIAKQIHLDAISAQFSDSTVKTIEDAGHWLHAEQTEPVLNEIKRFLSS
ncbi:acyl-CoA esterase [Acinetobacter sp. TGL-Y2]|uniref:alpha/beta fold hydrolase n=1 Tax=Acinetobacter sp. TGL-Y2 TaxID=1407071 RepID=UPI0007A6548C|nr:alpha/beta fold hydrolase [Acinetobacter sp. TGL-Y2]AMW78840.1 acyl-CoA esterase [Acinetobacter sp. TGL-Y2]